MFENSVPSVTSFISGGTHTGLSLTSPVISSPNSLNPRLFPRNTQPTGRFFCQLRKSQFEGCRHWYATLQWAWRHNKLPPSHGIMFCRLTVCKQKHYELIFRPYSWNLYHIDWLLFGCQRMDQVQKLKPSWQSFIFAFLTNILNKLSNIAICTEAWFKTSVL